ncbi:MAG: His-Xaa-Ser system protein HxsD [Rhodothermaceae bacterium]|nr:His-Xaa-Ser system protein HxsD [Rhodothermaceae bacterium]MBC12422.1 His-Xaa-Ser system protein HxsD [Rhodothermaceae bacterium]
MNSETMVTRQGDGSVAVLIDACMYPEDVVFKAFYWYGGDYDVQIGRDGDRFEVILSRLDGSLTEGLLDALRSRVGRDLIDFKTRSIVARETQAVRELLVAKAFAPLDDLDSQPPGDPSDPVGFDIADWQ